VTCAQEKLAPRAPWPPTEEKKPEPVQLADKWRRTSFGAYLAPKSGYASDDGGVDIIFHFHMGQQAEKEWREVSPNAVIVACQYGMGSAPYEHAFSDPARFGRMIDEVLRDLAQEHGLKQPVHARRVTLLAWSAGFGSVGQILKQGYYDQIDTVVLLDGIHGVYTHQKTVDPRSIEHWVRFARDATLGKKAMIITHSSIIPPDYPSSTETADALCDTLGIARAKVAEKEPDGMTLIERADLGDLHMRGFAGTDKKDHVDNLHLLDDVMLSFVVPRWTKLDEQAGRR
jgi:hypothetical protein